MQRFLSRLLILAILFPLALFVAPSHAASPTAMSHDLLVLRTGTTEQPALMTMNAAYRDGHNLDFGLFDRIHHVLYIATPQSGTRSLIQQIDAATGRTVRSLVVSGAFSTHMPDTSGASLSGSVWSSVQREVITSHPAGPAVAPRQSFVGVPLPGPEQTLAVLSFNGRWLALRDIYAPPSTTHVIVIDTTSMHLVDAFDVIGSFGLDAITADGAFIYLLEPLTRISQDTYQIRLYDRHRHLLSARPLSEQDGATTLQGVAWTRVWSPRGDWLFTLYERSGYRSAFVHALGVASHQVYCIMMPDFAGASDSDLAHFTLSAAPDGTALYAINPVLGRAVVVRDHLPYGTPRVTALAQRTPSDGHPLSGAAMTPDGRTLFVATDSGIWALDTASLRPRMTYLAGRPLSSIALSPDGQRLYALDLAHHSISILAAADGHVVNRLSISSSVWSIDKVMNE